MRIRISESTMSDRTKSSRTKTSDGTNPASPANAPTRRQAIVGVAFAFGGLALGSSRAAAETSEISHSAESIHQEPVINASPKRVYEALLDTKQFDQVIQLSGAMKSMRLGDKPTEISREVGGAFALFGGYITGRHVELLPGQRIVQAWRTGSWDAGVYSIVRFGLVEQGPATRIVFDHTGFPIGAAETLASGWKEHYWEPLNKLLS